MSLFGITASAFNGGAPPSVVYATGGTVTSISGFKIHTFNSSDTFATTADWPSGRTIQYLVVAGGGGSNNPTINGYGGGGGAGGLLTASGVALSASTNYVATIGAGGGANTNGTNSTLIGGAVSVTAIGGGGSTDQSNGNGQAGGSGGGGQNIAGYGQNGFGGAGTAGQGNAGANGTGKQDSGESGGGGGAGYAGGITSGPNFSNAYGGFGLVSTIFPETTSSTTVTTPVNALYNSFTFTVASGLWFTEGQSISVTNPGNANLAMCGIVTSYSGTSLVCKLRLASNVGFATSASSWIITYGYAGGGAGVSQGGFYIGASLGGGGGIYSTSTVYNANDELGGLPNSGGGGAQNAAPKLQGGSGVILIKYEYP